MSSRALTRRRVAVIDEVRCIGCTLCIEACPFDAILGAAKQMHTVLSALCTGCDLCVAPCPVDCISMVPASGAEAVWNRTRALAAKERARARKLRLARDQAERWNRLAQQAQAEPAHAEPGKRAVVQAAIQRARARRTAAKAVAGSRHRRQP